MPESVPGPNSLIFSSGQAGFRSLHFDDGALRLPDRLELLDGQAIAPIVLGIHDDRQAVERDFELDVFDAVVPHSLLLFVLDRPRGVADVDLTGGELLEAAAGAREPDRPPAPPDARCETPPPPPR